MTLKNYAKIAGALVALSFVLAGCEPLHRDIEPVWGLDVGFEDVDGDGDGECTPGGACGPCEFGEYVCLENGQRACQGAVNLQTDTAHCGQCGNACGTEEACQAGECVLTGEVCTPGGACGTCNTGEFVCNAADERVCEGEIDLNTSNAHCGQCNRACSAGESCRGGFCEADNAFALSAVACRGQLELVWEPVAGADRYVVEWTNAAGNPWTGGGVSAVQGTSGIIVHGGAVERVDLHFSQTLTNFAFRVRAQSGTQLVRLSETVQITVPQQDVGSVTDTAAALIVPAGAIYTVFEDVTKSTSIQIDGTLCISANVGDYVEFSAPSIEVSAGGAISATAAGFGGGSLVCTGQQGSTGGGGAAYGGAGHSTCSPSSVYGDTQTREIERGSGGGGSSAGSGPGAGAGPCTGVRSQNGGRGGGAMWLSATESLVIAGKLLANGSGPFGNCVQEGGSGSGGGILLEGEGIVVDAGAKVLAQGGSLGQAGGGGRIKVFDSADVDANARLSASGGRAGATNAGGDGTVFVEP